jgi:hypothetical protein
MTLRGVSKILKGAVLLSSVAACTGGAVIDSGKGNAPVQNAYVTWGTNNLLTGQVWVAQSNSQGEFFFNIYGDPYSSNAVSTGRNVVKVESNARKYIFVLDNHQYSTTCHSPGGGTMSCSEDVFDIGNGSPPATTIDSTFAVTPTAVPVHKPDACMTMCANAPANTGQALAGCYANCYFASTNQVPSLDTWLQSYPGVASRLTWRSTSSVSVGWANFSEPMRASVRQFYSSAWTWLQSGMQGDPFWLPDPATNVLAPTLGATSFPATALAQVDAWNLWASNIGLMMALQFGRRLPWDLADLDWLSLAQLLDSRSMFLPAIIGGNEVYSVGDSTTAQGVPVSPSTAYRFLVNNGLIGKSRRETIDRTLDWARQNLAHFGGGYTVANMNAYWQYPGLPPVIQVLNGTVTSDPGPHHPFANWTMGCHGTSAMLKSVLMAVQVPVSNGNSSGGSGSHAVPYFVSEHLFLDHGDDPYNHLSTSADRFPIDQLLLDANNPNNQLVVIASAEGLPVAVLQDYPAPHSTVGKRVADLAIGWTPWLLVQKYCADQASNATHANGSVYKYFQENYDVNQLEQIGLWGILQQTVLSVGSCANVPNIPDTSANGRP